MHSELIGGA
jgi:hypothetical protein